MTAAKRTVADEVWQPQDADDYVWRLINDPRFFLETFVNIRFAEGQSGPFAFNRTQHMLYELVYREAAPNVWLRHRFDELHGKGRQFGDSTLQIGLMYHAWATGAGFGPAFVGKVLAFADHTAQQLKDIAEFMHDSALSEIRDSLGIDPYEVLPKGDIRNAHELSDSNRGCKLMFASERTKGSGRATTANWLYVTDLSEWTTYEDAIAGYAGSLSKTGREVVVRDFTGKGPGNAAHRLWEKMTASESPAVLVRFIGTSDIDYPEGYLERQRELIGDQTAFEREYPSRPEHMFRADPNARFHWEWLDAAHKRDTRFMTDYMTDEEIMAVAAPCHCIDSAEGTPAGDYSVIKSRDALTGLEICPPFRAQASPDDTAAEVVRRHERFPGLINPLRKNHGSAVISRLKVHGLSEWLYRQTDIGNKDGKEGLDENSLTVPQMQTAYEVALKETTINLPSENGRMEASIFGLQKNGKIAAPPGFHDDEIVADMGCVMVFAAAVRKWQTKRQPFQPFVQQSARSQEYS
jgi:hypothetical protein